MRSRGYRSPYARSAPAITSVIASCQQPVCRPTPIAIGVPDGRGRGAMVLTTETLRLQRTDRLGRTLRLQGRRCELVGTD